MSRVFFVFIISLSALVGSISGQSGCGSTPTSSNWRDQMERTEESQRQMGRIGYECDGYSGGSSSGSTSPIAAIFEFLFLFFIISGIVVGIWCLCVQRQRAINAANLNNVSGQGVGAHQVAHGNELKLYPQTNTVQKGDPNYQV